MLMFVFFIGLIGFVAVNAYINRKNNKLIEQVTPLYRGEETERMLVLELLKFGVNPKAIFHDLYIKKKNGEYTQIDAVVATSAGLVVFEVKDYSGWIFGNEQQKYWTQVLAYGREKHRFYNPIMQNAGHIKALRLNLPQNPDIPIYSVVVFYGSSELKSISCYSPNTYVIYPNSINNLMQFIMGHPDAKFGNKYEVMSVLTQAVENGNDPIIVSSQRYSSGKYSQNTPASTYTYTYTYTFYQHIMFRHSCGVCHFTNLQRPSDVTIADFWGWQKVDETFNADDKGVSLVLVNTDKGRRLFDAVKASMHYLPSDTQACLQPNLLHPSEIHPMRDQFERDYVRHGLVYVMKRYGDMGWRYKLKVLKRKLRTAKRLLLGT